MLRHHRLSLCFALLASLAGCSGPGAKRDEGPPPQPIRDRPAWLKEGIVMAGNWEPLTFIRRRGGHLVEDEENWKAERSAGAARKLKEAGVNLVVTNLHKGFGLKAEAEDIEATRQFTGFAHAQGMRVGGYIGATMMFETFFAEEPEAKNWTQVDEHGAPICYNPAQTFRYVACRNNPGYRAFIEKVLRLGVQDIRLDLIHFDQIQGWDEPRSCRCPHCREQFREFLKAKYKPEELRLRFGFTRLDDVGPPAFDAQDGRVRLPDIVNPTMQDWVLFRCASLARRYGEYDHFIHALNSQVALEGNPNLDAASPKGFLYGVDLGQLLDHGDIVWSEEAAQASWTPDGRLISKIRSFKAVRSMGKSLFVYTGGRYGAQDPASPPELRMAEAIAYNDVNLGMVGDVRPDGVSLSPAAVRYIGFFKNHVKDLAGSASAANVGVLRAFAAVNFNPAGSNVSTILAEQTLIQNRIPWDMLFDRHLDNLDKYKVLVLANQDALSDAQAARIREFVRRGGGLVATENTSMLTDWRLERRKFALSDVLGVDRPAAPGAAPLQREFGKGRSVYIPRIEPAGPLPERLTVSSDFSPRHWTLPKNAATLAAAVRWAARDDIPLTLAAPPSVAAELAERKTSSTLLLHVINFDLAKPVENLQAGVRLPAGFLLQEAILESPDDGLRQTLKAVVANGVASFRIPKLKVYGLVTLRGATT